MRRCCCLIGDLNMSRNPGTWVSNGSITGDVRFDASGTTFVKAGGVSGTITFLSAGVYVGRIGGAVTVTGSASVQKFVMEHSTSIAAFDVDISDGGGDETLATAPGWHSLRFWMWTGARQPTGLSAISRRTGFSAMPAVTRSRGMEAVRRPYDRSEWQ